MRIRKKKKKVWPPASNTFVMQNSLMDNAKKISDMMFIWLLLRLQKTREHSKEEKIVQSADGVPLPGDWVSDSNSVRSKWRHSGGFWRIAVTPEQVAHPLQKPESRGQWGSGEKVDRTLDPCQSLQEINSSEPGFAETLSNNRLLICTLPRGPA